MFGHVVTKRMLVHWHIKTIKKVLDGPKNPRLTFDRIVLRLEINVIRISQYGVK